MNPTVNYKQSLPHEADSLVGGGANKKEVGIQVNDIFRYEEKGGRERTQRMPGAAVVYSVVRWWYLRRGMKEVSGRVMRISENIPGKENSHSKDPKAGVSLVCV